jgi:hypothetical protein
MFEAADFSAVTARPLRSNWNESTAWLDDFSDWMKSRGLPRISTKARLAIGHPASDAFSMNLKLV